jgi:inorganic pyrophosphatase
VFLAASPLVVRHLQALPAGPREAERVEEAKGAPEPVWTRARREALTGVMTKAAKRSPHAQLPPVDKKTQSINVVIETPRNCRNKFKFDEKLGLFRLNSVLPVGSVFPYDFGYVPGTRAEDGDPVDVLLWLDEPVFTGCVVRARLIGVLEAEQTENGKTARNDRLLAVACDSRDHGHIRSEKDIDEHVRKEIEHFFVSYHQLTRSRFKVLGYHGPSAAKRMLRKTLL